MNGLLAEEEGALLLGQLGVAMVAGGVANGRMGTLLAGATMMLLALRQRRKLEGGG